MLGVPPPQRRTRRRFRCSARLRSGTPSPASLREQTSALLAVAGGAAALGEAPMVNENTILADRNLIDLIERLDVVRELHEQADTADALRRVQTLVGDALRQATDFLVELRRQQLGI